MLHNKSEMGPRRARGRRRWPARRGRRTAPCERPGRGSAQAERRPRGLLRTERMPSGNGLRDMLRGSPADASDTLFRKVSTPSATPSATCRPPRAAPAFRTGARCSRRPCRIGGCRPPAPRIPPLCGFEDRFGGMRRSTSRTAPAPETVGVLATASRGGPSGPMRQPLRGPAARGPCARPSRPLPCSAASLGAPFPRHRNAAPSRGQPLAVRANPGPAARQGSPALWRQRPCARATRVGSGQYPVRRARVVGSPAGSN